MSNCTYPNLSSEGKIGSLALKNRIFMAPTETLYASACGEATNELIAYYRRRAKGGVGMIVLHSIQGNAGIDPQDPYAGSLRLDNNAFIPKMSDLTEAVHQAGSKIAALVSIGGGARGAGEHYITGCTLETAKVAPSVIPGEPVRALSADEIHRTVEAYGRCAWRARAAGFDAFYIHALGSYLLAEFLSPLFNRRTDAYGGSAENRWRLLFELIASCSCQAGADFPLVVRLSVDEMHKEGRALEESLRFLPKLVEAGVSALDVTAGLMDPLRCSLPSIYVPKGINWDAVKKVKQAVTVPVICGGKIVEPCDAEALLGGGVCDFVSIGREFIAGPDWPKKTFAGREAEIRRCLTCNYCIGHRIMQRLPLRCAFNPMAGREWAEPEAVLPAEPTRKIVVIGAGPAGLEAARVLGLRGHAVDVYEASGTLCGGQIRLASAPPCKGSLSHIARYYERQLEALPNVCIHLNERLDAEKASALKADQYLVATGAAPWAPNIPGIDSENIYTAEQVLSGTAAVDENVLILGGGQVGAETALLLSEQGKKVTVVDQLSEIAPQEEPLTRGGLLYLLNKNGVRFHAGLRVSSLSARQAVVQSVADGRETVLPFDTAVLAFGMRPENALAKALRAAGCPVQTIGDAERVGTIATAIAKAHAAARSL